MAECNGSFDKNNFHTAISSAVALSACLFLLYNPDGAVAVQG
jgi:hypothetical protein